MSTIKVTKELLDDIVTKAKAATQGPWKTAYQSASMGDKVLQYGVYTKSGRHIGVILELFARYKKAKENTEYIASASPEVVLALIDLIKNQEKNRCALEAMCGWLTDTIMKCAGNDGCTFCKEEWCPQRSSRAEIIEKARRAVEEQKMNML